MREALSQADRQRKHRESLAAMGQVSVSVHISAEAAAALEKLQDLAPTKNKGRIVSEAIEFAVSPPATLYRMARTMFINSAVAWAAQGWSPRRIARELNRLGIPTLSGRGRWAHSIIQRLLKESMSTDVHLEPRRGV